MSETDKLADVISTWYNDLPVEIRNRDFALLGRSTIGDLPQLLATAKLQSANNFLSVKLPGGGRIAESLGTNLSDEALRKSLRLRVMEQLASSALPIFGVALPISLQKTEVDAYFPEENWLQTASAAPQIKSLPSKIKVRRFRPFPISSGDLTQEAVSTQVDIPTQSVRLSASEAIYICQILRPGQAARNVVVPPGVILSIVCIEDKPIELFADFRHSSANRIMTLRLGARLDELASLVRSFGQYDFGSLCTQLPSAALVLAYASLRGAEPAVLGMMIEQLKAKLGQIPDTAVIAGEFDARQGNIGSSLEALLSVAGLGLPCFSSGLGYLSDRLRFYRRASQVDGDSEDINFEMTADQRDCLDKTISAVENFAAATDFTAPLTTYVGIDPQTPSNSVVTLEQFDAVDTEVVQLS